jgi:transposase
MRIIGLDIHRVFAEAVVWENGRLKRLGRVDMRRDFLAAFAAKLSPNDVVVIESTGNAASAAGIVAPHIKKVVIANPKQVRIIAHAKIKTDTIEYHPVDLHSHLIPPCPHADLCGAKAGRGWVSKSCRRTSASPSTGICVSSIGLGRISGSLSATFPVRLWRMTA